MDSLLVLTGVSAHEDLSTVVSEQRPTHVRADLTGLLSSGAAASR
jgi:ribonucleotide monophosphatase NagD (HAD superfamily)